MTKARDNHYVPQWYQRGFLLGHVNKLHYLDLNSDSIKLSDGSYKSVGDRTMRVVSQCFYQTDLYTTFFGEYINDEIESRLFGKIDDSGAKAVRAFISEDVARWHHHFMDFFTYIDSQKIRTPKGLSWINNHYPNLGKVDLLREMQVIRNLHCTIWTEGVREIVTAKNSAVKFILTDHPVTVYNYACPPDSDQCVYPNEPSILLKGSQTFFPLDKDHCLILTNYEYAKDPDNQNPAEKRTNPRFMRNSMVRTDKFIRSRQFNEDEIRIINFILKMRARRYIAAPDIDWLYPEKYITKEWVEMRYVLLPPENELWGFGGELYAGNKNGSTYYQDAFGRTTPENKYLKKNIEKNLGKNDPCGCGSGKKFNKCCENKSEDRRPTWKLRSIRERNIFFCNGVNNILGLNKDKTWDDVRRELNDDHVKKIHELYEFLWPVNTDIFSLLPTPDDELRALYTGVIDPRVIWFPLGFIPYFDEIIIQHPFINPATVKPEFSPTKSPKQYKQQTLKNVLLLLMLEPFIKAGYVNFIPDICSFDQHLRNQVLNMAEERTKNIKFEGDEEDLLKRLNKEDVERTIRMLPKEHQKGQIARAMPDLSDDQIDEILQYMESQNEKDPLTLLQNDVLGRKEGQLMTLTIAPNFELSFIVAQVTGSILITDSSYRWKEIKNAQYKEGGVSTYPWENLSNLINELEYVININPELSFRQRAAGKYGNIRKSLREVFTEIQTSEDKMNNRFVKRIEKISGFKKTGAGEKKLEPNSFYGKINCVIPKGGFVHNYVQRLLLTSSSSSAYLNNVPMAIFT
jgi:hypothetical protein